MTERGGGGLLEGWDQLTSQGGQPQGYGRGVVMCVVMLLASVLALREAIDVGAPSTELASGEGRAPAVQVHTTSATVEAATTTTTTPTTPIDVAAGNGEISLTALARQALAEAQTITTTTKRPAAPVSTVRSTTTTLKKTVAAAAPAIATTTTTKVKPTTTTAAAGVSVPPVALGVTLGNTQTGVASWFSAPDGSCAHNTIPKGTVVKITRLATGVTTTCKVDQGGPSDTTRIIDLSKDTFVKLADLSIGLIDVRIEW